MTDVHCQRCRRHFRAYSHVALSAGCPNCGERLRPGVGRGTRPDTRAASRLDRVSDAEARRRELDARRP